MKKVAFNFRFFRPTELTNLISVSFLPIVAAQPTPTHPKRTSNFATQHQITSDRPTTEHRNRTEHYANRNMVIFTSSLLAPSAGASLHQLPSRDYDVAFNDRSQHLATWRSNYACTPLRSDSGACNVLHQCARVTTQHNAFYNGPIFECVPLCLRRRRATPVPFSHTNQRNHQRNLRRKSLACLRPQHPAAHST